MPRLSLILALLAAAPLVGCRREAPDPDGIDGQPTAGIAHKKTSADALGNQIVVDPALAGKAIALPTTPGSHCEFTKSLAWARRLPAELPVYPGARLTEAAGSDASGCRRRIVSFTAPATPAQLIAFYGGKASAAGYSVEHLVEQGSDVLGGTKGDAAYYLTVIPAKGGSSVDLVSNDG